MMDKELEREYREKLADVAKKMAGWIVESNGWGNSTFLVKPLEDEVADIMVFLAKTHGR